MAGESQYLLRSPGHVLRCRFGSTLAPNHRARVSQRMLREARVDRLFVVYSVVAFPSFQGFPPRLERSQSIAQSEAGLRDFLVAIILGIVALVLVFVMGVGSILVGSVVGGASFGPYCGGALVSPSDTNGEPIEGTNTMSDQDI